MDSYLKDVRFALRGWRKRPGFTAIAVLTVGIGIGATTAIRLACVNPDLTAADLDSFFDDVLRIAARIQANPVSEGVDSTAAS